MKFSALNSQFTKLADPIDNGLPPFEGLATCKPGLEHIASPPSHGHPRQGN
jgi:hypothetical protein